MCMGLWGVCDVAEICDSGWQEMDLHRARVSAGVACDDKRATIRHIVLHSTHTHLPCTSPVHSHASSLQSASPPVAVDAEVARQPRYAAFAEQINKALAGFERAREWADLITCLQRLSRALGRGAPPFPTIPSRLLLGRRLAQCLNAALPSGVHLEAIETYELLFHRIGVRHESDTPEPIAGMKRV